MVMFSGYENFVSALDRITSGQHRGHKGEV